MVIYISKKGTYSLKNRVKKEFDLRSNFEKKFFSLIPGPTLDFHQPIYYVSDALDHSATKTESISAKNLGVYSLCTSNLRQFSELMFYKFDYLYVFTLTKSYKIVKNITTNMIYAIFCARKKFSLQIHPI